MQMAKARQKSEWQRTALQTTILANCWTSKNSRLKMADFPYCGPEQQPRIDTPEKLKWFFDNFMKGL